jgi:streptogramin lyase
MSSLKRLIRAGLLTLCVLIVGVAAQATEWQRGDVFVAVGNGQIQVYRLTNNGEFSSYTLIETLTDGSGTVSGENGTGGTGFTTGCTFDSTGHLYTTNFSNGNVYKFPTADPHTVLQTIPGSAGALSPESIVFDGLGNFFVGHADGTHVVDKFSPTGVFQQSFTVATEDRGSDWIELSPDGTTLYYTSEGTSVKTFNLSTNTQGPDFYTEGEGNGTFFTVRVLPPSFGNFAGDVLVANTGNILRLHAGDGVNVAQTYTIDGAQFLFALALDTNGSSFWAGDLLTGNIYRINVSSGVVEYGPIATGAIPNGENSATVGGMCVNGAAGASQPQPVVQTVTLTPANNTATVSNDNNSNAWQTTLNGLTQTAHVTIAFTEIAQSAGNSDLPGYGACELASADGTKCVVHQISVDTNAYSSIDFYHHWNFKPTTPINPRMIKNGTSDITTAVFLDPGTKGHTNTPSTYVDNEGPTPTASSCGGFIVPPNGLTWEAEFPLTFLFRAAANSSRCNKGPFLTNLSPVISLARVDPSGTVTPVTLSSTSFKVLFGVWYYILPTKNLQPGTYVVTVLDLSNHIASFSEKIKIVPDND